MSDSPALDDLRDDLLWFLPLFGLLPSWLFLLDLLPDPGPPPADFSDLEDPWDMLAANTADSRSKPGGCMGTLQQAGSARISRTLEWEPASQLVAYHPHQEVMKPWPMETYNMYGT